MSVVVGFVPTPEGRAALVRAATEAHLRRTSLVVVASQGAGPEKDPKKKDAVARLEAELERIGARLKEQGLTHELRRLDRGRLPSEDLLEVAEDVDAELIVIGLRRRSPVGKLILGSQAQQILLDASRPVLAVKASD